jgi:type III pantothenate kinase
MPLPALDKHLVIDVGNTRVKWGLCNPAEVEESISLEPDAEESWRSQLEAWNLSRPLSCTIAGVHPKRRDRVALWFGQRGDHVTIVDSARQLSLEVAVDQPDRVGIDRLLNAVAVNTRRRAGRGAVIIDAGSAVTVDFLDEQGRFQGGAIFPGLGLMAAALHDHTALLPLIEVRSPAPPVGKSTVAAMHAGIFHAAAGAIDRLIQKMTPPGGTIDVFFGGGDANVLAPELSHAANLWPLMTLEGLRLTARSLR